MSDVRTRFAPSPTGYLHIGGARTALYNFIFARQTGGKFFLRIEDTDKQRSTDENTRAIYDGLKWLGLDWDNEKPILQSERTEMYVQHVQKLLEMGKAYRCYCTPEELEAKRKLAEKEKRPQGYDRTCRRRVASGDLTSKAGFPFTVRAAFEETGETVVDDLIKGRVVQNNAELSDEVILRADGSPLYNLCVVVDDVDMKISHVLRGDDHLMNTFKQIQLYKAFGYALPKFGHLPLIFDMQGKKVSKRSGTVVAEVHRYKEMGYLPEAMINFLARLGWSLDDKTEEFSIADLVKVFTIEKVSKSAAKFDIKRLDNLDGAYIRKRTLASLADELAPIFQARGWTADRRVLEAVASAGQQRAKTLVELADNAKFLFVDPPVFDEKAVEKNLKGKAALLDDLAALIAAIEPFENASVHTALEKYAAEKAAGKLGDVAGPLRVALTGGSVSPPIQDVITLLGKPRVASRLALAKAQT